jgi:hypothetical protein
MKKIIVLTIMSFFIICRSVDAQAIFQKTYSAGGAFSSCYSVDATSDSGFITAGIVISGTSDACITKTNSSGAVQWSKTLGGVRSENIFSVKQIANGGYVVAGTSRSYSVDSLNQIYIIRLSSTGNADWEKTYGSFAGSDEMGAHRISQTTDGGFIIGGYEDAFSVGMLYLKTDSSGTISWGKFVSGSTGTYGVESILQTADGGYIITGNGGKLIKTDTSGNITWSKSYINGAISFCAQQTSDGGYMLAGETNFFGSGSYDMYLIKTDSSGSVSWCKTFGGTLYDNLRSAQQTSDGGYILAGFTNSFGAGSTDIYVIKTDSAGNLLWSKTYGSAGDEMSFSVREAPAGGFIIAGQTNGFGAVTYSSYLIKTDANGTSGCNDSTPLTLVTSPVVIATTLSEIASNYIPDTFTPVSPIGAGLVEGLLCLSFPTAVAEVNGSENDFSIAPNPATNYFMIGFDKTISKGEVEFYDVLGKMIFTEKINNETKKVINLTNISEGIYFVKVHDGEKYYCKKLIVE